MKNFACNVLEVQTKSGEPVVLISERALRSLLPGQVNAISQFSEILSVKIDTIEHHGGGGIRCMIAGIHLQASK